MIRSSSDPGTTRVEITVAGHTVSIESPAPLAETAAMAYALFRRTDANADRSTVGFDIPPPDVTLAPPYPRPSDPEEEMIDARRMGR